MADDSHSPDYPKSKFADNLTRRSGILELMDDLGEAMTTGRGKMLMMGGGNPGHIPEMQALWRTRFAELLQNQDEFDAVLGDYDQPAGSPRFRQAVAAFFQREFDWPISAKNVAITNGGQTAFFCLLNRFGGRMADETKRQRILLPLLPEYIGYSDQSVGHDFFDARRPSIEHIDDRTFKYHIDFDKLHVGDDIGAIAVSRPTNPSSNVLTDDEIQHLSELARDRHVPLIIDNAYGAPFPGVIFETVTPVWDEHIVLTLSLSKLGLPGTRTGIVIAREDIAAEISAMTAVISLANNNVGQAIAAPLIESGDILQLANEVVRPFYEKKSATAQALLREHLPADIPWRVHKSEGAFFLWLWFEGLPITTRELYRRLRDRHTLIVPGEYFFFGLDDDGNGDSSEWRHTHECIRLSYTQSQETLERGIDILGEEITKAYAGE